jgi:hypothetical protein
MRIASVVLVLSLCSTILCSPAHAENDPAFQRLIEQKAGAIVSMQVTYAMSMGSRTQEGSGSLEGILLSKDGLIMIQNPSPGGNFKISLTEIRVIFPGDVKEYDAILVAQDSKVGLAFVRIKDLEGKQVTPLEIENSVEPKVGDLLYGVARKSQNWDYAPYCATLRVIAQLSKPRKLWDLDGNFAQRAHPVFTAEGVVAGVLVNQEGVGGGQETFILPWKIAAATIKRAERMADEALEEARKRDAEAAAQGEGEKPAVPPPAVPPEGPGPHDPAPGEPEMPDEPEVPADPDVPEEPETPEGPAEPTAGR